MTDALRLARKAVSIAVTTSTIVWSVGLASFAPMAARAAQPGQLIKTDGNSAVYYLHTDMKRYVFPNEATYKSWYADFSSVVTVSQSELQSYTIGPTIVLRAGTKLAKVTTDPKVYAVEPGGVFRWVGDATIAQTLFGDNWASRVVDIPDVFFSDYTVGSPINSNNYPSGSLIKSASSSDIYYVDGSSKRKLTSSGITGNNFNVSNVVTAPDSVFNALSMGSDVTANEAGLWNVVSGATNVNPGGTGLTVAIAPDSPASGIHASMTAYNNALKVNLTAASDGAVNLNGLTLTRLGLSQDANISGVGVFDANGMRHGNFVSFANTKAVITFSNDPIVVPAGQTVPVWVKTNIESTVQTGTYAVQIASASDLNTSAAVTGSFPVTGNGFSLISGSGSVGSLNVDVVNIATTTVNVDVGVTDYQLTKLRFIAGANEPVKVSKVRVFVSGSTDDDDLKNFELIDPNGTVLATVAQATGRYVTFNLTTPYEIPEGNQKDLTVRVDVTDGSTRTAQIQVQNDYDVEAMGAETGSGLLASSSSAGGNTVDTTFPVGDITTGNSGFNHITIREGSLTIAKSSDSPSGEIGKGTSNTKIAVFELEAKGEDIEVQKADINMAGTSSEADFTGTVKLQNESGATLYSTSASGAAAGIFDDNTADTDQVTLNSYFIVKSGTKAKIMIVADTATNATAGETAQGRISNIYFKRLLSNTYGTLNSGAAPGSMVSGNTLTITSNSLTVSSNAAYASQTLTAGQSDVKIGSFLLKTNNSEGVNVSSIVVRLTGANAFEVADISNLKLKRTDTNVQIGSTQSSATDVAGGANTFSVAGQLNIPANTTVQIDVYANVSTGSTDGGTDDTVQVTLNAGDVSGVGAVSGSTIPQTAAASLQTLTFVTSGSLTVAIDQSGAASSQHYTVGLSGVEMARIKLSTTNEGAKIQKLEVRSINGGGNVDTVKLLGTGLASDPVTNLTSGVATFTFSSGSELLVPSNSSKVVTVVVNTTPLQSLVAGNFGVLGFGTIDAIGSGSGVTVQESLTGTSYVAGTNAYSGDLGDVIYFTQTADAGTNTAPGFYIVTTDDDAVNLATGDLDLNEEATDTSWTAGDVITKLSKVEAIAGNANAGVNYNVGDLVYVFDTDDNTGAFAIVTTAVASGAAISGLGFSPAGTIAISAATDLVTKLTNVNGIVGNTMRFEEVEPVVTLSASSPSGVTSPNSEQTVAVLNVKAEGGRDMTFNSLTVEKNGSNTPERYVTKLSLWNGTTKISEVANSTLSVVGDGTNANADTTLSLCTGADPAAGEIGGITAAEAATLAVGDRVILRETAGGTAVSTGTITARSGTLAACGGASISLTFDSTMTVTGAMTAASIENSRVHFDANQSNTGDTALVEQSVTAGQTMTLTVKADTSSVKTGVSSGTVTFGVNVPGSTGPLQVGSTQIEGLNWDYSPLGTGTADYRTEADGYPVIGNALSY